jgi:hypothetical protein
MPILPHRLQNVEAKPGLLASIITETPLVASYVGLSLGMGVDEFTAGTR